MATKIYGASDDLIEFEGDVRGEANPSYSDESAGTLIICDDGTLLSVKYGKPGHGGVWGVTLIRAGTLFDRIDVCTDDEADPYSDVAHFRDGLKGAYAAKDWERVK